MKLVMKTLQWLLMKKETIENENKVLEWWKVKEKNLKNTEKKENKLIEEDKTKGIDKVIRQST